MDKILKDVINVEARK